MSMNEMSPQRRKVVVLASSVACMSGGPILLKGHPRLLMVWLCVMVVTIVFAVVQLSKLKGQAQ
jgi:hypothetical protein